MNKYIDRADAGRILAKYLMDHAGQKDAILLALPRGGVPVAYEIARILSIPMDVFIVRKLGVPGYEELAMGAVAPGDIVTLNHLLISQLNIDQAAISQVLQKEQQEMLPLPWGSDLTVTRFLPYNDKHPGVTR